MSLARCAVFVLAAVLAGGSAGCGYALAGRGAFLPDYVRVVGIPPLANRSTFFQVEEVLTDKIRTEFIGRGKYTVVSDGAPSDATLTGEVSSISIVPVGFTEQQLASRYLFTLTMRIQFTDTRTGEVLWSNESLSFRSEYELSTRGNTAIEGAGFVDQERNSFDRIANDVARTVVTAILEAF